MPQGATRTMSAPPKQLQTKLSTWTPLNHQMSNNHVFEERRLLLRKWFDKWSDGQRKAVLRDVLWRCSASQLRHLQASLVAMVPQQVLDFTAVLPRVLSLYIFSFLDPRSLCRSAQVSWHWRGMVELDQLWMPKCVRLGWYINFTPSPFEQGVWKRHYIETVKDLHVSKPKTPVKEAFVVPEVHAIGHEEDRELAPTSSANQPRESRSRRGVATTATTVIRSSVGGASTAGPPPWRHADLHPTDTRRFNYLENPDPIQQARRARAKGKRINLSSTAPPEDNTTQKKALSASAYKLRKAKSLMFLSMDQQAWEKKRPDWAVRSAEPDQYPVSKEAAERLARSGQWNAGIRPAPVRPPVPRLSAEGLRASLRTHRSSPSVPLFEERPWKIPSSRDSQEG
ncbi:F-box only protein 16 [Engraulis encrasicolus]|uniref:F-box only protein 16 n=1 Tax=Engraulis encrasicolus TaxID=184585 RepID=UPI002FD7449C